MAAAKLISPSTFRALDRAFKTRILRALERQGRDHVMYVFVDDFGRLTKVIPCCEPAAPCPPEAFRIRRRMGRLPRAASAA